MGEAVLIYGPSPTLQSRNPDAGRFLDHLKSDAATAVFREQGYIATAR